MNANGPIHNRPEEVIPIIPEVVEDHMAHIISPQGNLAFRVLEKIIDQYNTLDVSKLNTKTIFLWGYKLYIQRQF